MVWGQMDLFLENRKKMYERKTKLFKNCKTSKCKGSVSLDKLVKVWDTNPTAAVTTLSATETTLSATEKNTTRQYNNNNNMCFL